jgi:Icc-related predicted phosphoesterase
LGAGSPERAGCEKLRDRIKALSFLRLHVFGHIHEGYGTATRGGVQYVNAAICDRSYRPVNAPVVVDL